MRSLIPLLMIFISIGSLAAPEGADEGQLPRKLLQGKPQPQSQVAELLSGLEAAPAGPAVNCSESVRSNVTRDAGECGQPFVPMEPGTHRLMHRVSRRGPLGNQLSYETGNYLLRALPSGRFQAILNLNFVKEESSTDTTNEDVQAMLQKSRECMHQLVPYLKSGGRNLEIVILNQEEVNETLPRDQRPASRTVKVSREESGFRGHAEHFGTNFDCTTIGHELLHHLGLCDEYHETEAEKFSDWGCRPVTVRPSYMRDMHFSFNSTVPQTNQCECNETCREIMGSTSRTKDIFLKMNDFELIEHQFRSLYCQTSPIAAHEPVENVDSLDKAFLVRSESPNVTVYESRRATGATTVERNRVTCTCPAGAAGDYCRRATAEIKRKASLDPKRANCPNGYPPRGEKRIGAFGETGVQGDVLTLVTRGNGGSLMEPNHFAKVLGGNCRGAAPQYETCASYAYIPADSEHCRSMPPECSDDNYYLGR